MKKYQQFIKQLTYLGLILVFTFGIRSFKEAIPDRIYMTGGSDSAYDFAVPVKVVLKDGGTEVFENFSRQSGENPPKQYTVTCKLFGIFPVKDVEVMLVNENYVYASGMPVGIYAKTDGVLIIGTGAVEDAVGKESRPSENLVKSGDYIVSINGEAVSEKDDLMEKINDYGENREVLGIRRNREYIEVAVNPVKNKQGNYKLGIWVRDDLAGVGTLTYCERDGKFGALGHAISDCDTGNLMEMSRGFIYKTDIIGIKKGRSGEPGELSGIINYGKEERLGRITKNLPTGIRGQLEGNAEKVYRGGLCEVGYKQEIRLGTAYVVSYVSGESRLYEIQIENLDYSGREANKGILFRVTDKALLEQTGGIVQGMSGSPIVQNGKIIGAVTHVFVQDSTRGYGIFIENMLE